MTALALDLVPAVALVLQGPHTHTRTGRPTPVPCTQPPFATLWPPCSIHQGAEPETVAAQAKRQRQQQRQRQQEEGRRRRMEQRQKRQREEEEATDGSDEGSGTD